MTNEQCGMAGHEHSAMCYRKHVSWTAIIVGALVGVGLSFLLNLFSIAIGLSLVTTNQEGMTVLAVGGFLGLAIGTIASMFTAGFSAGYLGRPYCIKRHLGVLYGFTAWALALILTVLLATNIGHYVAMYADFIANPTIIVDVTNISSSSKGAVSATDTQTAVNHLGMSSLLVFALFFIGAFSSSLGGHCGMTYRCEDNCTTK